jgi:hypothetical protein
VCAATPAANLAFRPDMRRSQRSMLGLSIARRATNGSRRSTAHELVLQCTAADSNLRERQAALQVGQWDGPHVR